MNSTSAGVSAATPTGIALWQTGFRPFFCLASVWGAGLLLVWVLAWYGLAQPGQWYGMMAWHGHEMLFGYGVAVIAGFLLTAVQNWTQSVTARGGALAALTVLWLAGRVVAIWPHWFSPVWISVLDLMFLPLLALVIAVPIIRRGNRRNYAMPVIVLALAVANGLIHAGRHGLIAGGETLGMYLAVDIIMLLIAIIGGRILPFFTRNACPGSTPRTNPVVNWVAIGSTAAILVAHLFTWHTVAAGLAGLAAVAHGIRAGLWYSPQIWRQPLLWVLHLGYAWLVVGYALAAATLVTTISPWLAMHALTVGALGMLTVGMMVRVSIGHSGRPLQAPRLCVLAFVLIGLSALVRVFLPLLISDYRLTLAISGGLWVAVFLLLLLSLSGVWWRPRADGKPG